MSKLNEMTLYMAAVAVVEARKRDDKAWRDGGSARTDLSLAINTLEKAVELYAMSGMPASYDGNPLSYAECSKHGPYDSREVSCPKCKIELRSHLHE